MTQRLAVRGARILTDSGLKRRDLLIEDGRLARIAEEVDRETPTLDASGLIVLPGAIDAHVHFREPGLEHKEDWASGSRAAVAGGVTTVLDMPNTVPATTTLEALAEKRRRAERSSLVDFGVFFGLTEQNLDVALQAEGVVGLKIYMGSSTGGLLVTDETALESAFQRWPGVIVIHAEDEHLIQERRALFGADPPASAHSEIRNVDVALMALTRALDLARRYGTRLHVAHMSSTAEAWLVAAARREGVRVTCEVTPHHLLLDESLAAAGLLGTRAKVNPPLRAKSECDGLWKAIMSGTVDVIATDHAPHLPAEKDLPYEQAAAGLPSVELYLPLLLERVADGLLGLEDLVRVASEGPARVFGLRGKGRIEQGYDADLVLVDLEASRMVDASSIRSKCGWSPYVGRTLRGWPVMTLVRGQVVFGPEGYRDSAVGREVQLKRRGKG